jgi:hypothetical protein
MAAVGPSHMVGVGATVASRCTPTASIWLLCSFVFVITQHSCSLELHLYAVEDTVGAGPEHFGCEGPSL